jgi:hypothetical protein
MSLSTKAGLETAISTWLARTDTRISGNADDMITLCEAKLNRDLVLRVMWTNSNQTGTGGSSTIALPSDFVEAESLFLTTFGVQTKLSRFAPGEYEIGTTAGVPNAWAIDGANIQLDLPCDQAHTFIFRYRQRFALVNPGDTNWLLTNHPDVYLFCALVEAESLSKDTGQNWINLWQARAQAAYTAVAIQETRHITAATLRTEPMISTSKAFNIFTGQ